MTTYEARHTLLMIEIDKLRSLADAVYTPYTPCDEDVAALDTARVKVGEALAYIETHCAEPTDRVSHA